MPRTFVNTVFLGLLLVIGVNALLYASRAANPLIAADGWHSVDTVVRKAAAGELSLSDLFVKRGDFDHSQPLRKLILVFHYRWFDLDYGIEAIIGVLAAFVNLGIFWLMLRSPPREEVRAQHAPLQWLGFCALAAVYLSLNAAVVFNWPLLTLNYTSHFFVLLFFWAAWCGYRRADAAGWSGVFAAALLMDIVADDTGLVATLAVVLTIALHAWRERRVRAGLYTSAMALAAYFGYRVLYLWIMSGTAVSQGPAGIGIGNRLAGLANHASDIVQWGSVPLVAALAHRVQLHDWVGVDTTAIETVIMLLMVAAHLWFWWRAFAGTRNLASFVATALMLLFYGLVAGMLIARVSLQGSDYLWQPRYVLIYELHLVGLLLMALGQLGGGNALTPSRAHTGGRVVFAAAATLLLLLQVPWSVGTWRGVKYVSAYEQRMASAMGAIARDPLATPQGCAPQLIICRYNPQRRREVIGFLQANHLSVFSPAFRARNRLYPDAETLPH